MERKIEIDRISDTSALFGNLDSNLKIIEKTFDVTIISRDGELKINGDEESTALAERVLLSLIKLQSRGGNIDEQNVHYSISLVKEDREEKLRELSGDSICLTSKGKPLKPKTVGQKTYCEYIKNKTITIGVGPAGTGKTYLAVAMAVQAFRAGSINRIILTRPAVEAGEKLGFLPGDLQQKVDPYLRPLYDALFDMLGSET